MLTSAQTSALSIYLDLFFFLGKMVIVGSAFGGVILGHFLYEYKKSYQLKRDLYVLEYAQKHPELLPEKRK